MMSCAALALDWRLWPVSLAVVAQKQTPCVELEQRQPLVSSARLGP
jgi:hypothetical protein